MDFKATIYDLLGYFVPGLVCILLAVVIIFQMPQLYSIQESIIKSVPEIFSIHYVVLLVIISYIIGFLVSGLSNIYYDHFIEIIFPGLKNKKKLSKILGSEAY